MYICFKVYFFVKLSRRIRLLRFEVVFNSNKTFTKVA